MNEVTLIFPHQLYEQHPALAPERLVVLVEESLFFTHYQFHQQKLRFHRASMKAYEAWLISHNFQVRYVSAQESEHDVRRLIDELYAEGYQTMHMARVVDNWLEKHITQAAADNGMKYLWYGAPDFLLKEAEVSDYFSSRKRFFQADFYMRQRKKFGWLVSASGEPVGGKWSFDEDNRQRYPKDRKPPVVAFPAMNSFMQEATNYVRLNFASNPGSMEKAIHYPITFEEARAWLHAFLEQRFAAFGPYEDAIVAGENFLHHSILSPLLNIGLLTPTEVIESVIQYADSNEIPLSSLEGFIRQVAGWREFVRGVYVVNGKYARTKNFWNFKRKIPAAFYDGTTGILPVDITIRKVLQTGYSHHIERLMVLGNFMLLCEFDPDEVYRWFMELFIDAYDWVMVPNVYGMSQFADGGGMTTKPYLSGSNYLRKMSDYPKGDWELTWDALFWRFMDKHRDFFRKNPRMGMLVRTYDRMDADKKVAMMQRAEAFLKSLDETKPQLS